MNKKLEKEINRQLEALKEISACNSNICMSGICAAFKDPRVRSIFLRKIAEGHIFTGIHCEPSTFEHIWVVINFRCADGIFCLIPPTFAADVNLISGTVTSIDDPYIPSGPRSQSLPQPSAVIQVGNRVGNG